jgi:hypothetical protein
MKIIDKITSSLESLVTDKITYSKHEDFLDNNPDFKSVNRLWSIWNNEASNILTDIFDKLELSNNEYSGGKYTIMGVLSSFNNAQNQNLFSKALYKIHKSEDIEGLVLKLQALANDNKNIITNLINARNHTSLT